MGKAELAAIALIGLVVVGLLSFEKTPMSVNTEALFDSWLDLHGKHYDSHEEKLFRHGVWLENFNYVHEHNARFMLG